MDTSIYPGDVVMDDLLANTNLVWCGFYLGPAPSHPDPSWMDRRAHLTRTGWGCAPIYVGQQDGGPGSHTLSTKQGELDAENARFLANAAGFPKGSVIYLDVEAGGALSAGLRDYVTAWVDIVAVLDYVPGIYCSHTTVASINALGLDVRLWVYKLKPSDVGGQKQQPFKDDEPSDTGITDAVAWQWAQNCQIVTLNGTLNVDLDTASTADPSQP